MSSDQPPQSARLLEQPGLTDPSSGLAALWLAGLREALASSGVLFDRQRVGSGWRPTTGTESLTSSAIALIGLSRARIAPERIGLNPTRTLARLVDRVERAREPGPLGLVVWAGAVWRDPATAGLLDRWISAAGGMGSLTRRLRTMELAWLVAGLAHLGPVDGRAATRSALDEAVRTLLGRFEPASRAFWHADVDSPWKLKIRRRVATFADQIYPVQALALAAIATGDERALEVAVAAALRLATVQGALGQWWWHHDPVDGRVSGSYPVYAVHQHGMAPMSFATLLRAGGPDLATAVAAGRGWLDHNELGVDLIDRPAGTIWRSIVRDEGPARRLMRHARRLAGTGIDDQPAGATPRLRVNRETRPYEWAWYLFASAVEDGNPPRGHLV